MITLNGQPVEVTRFPDQTSQVWKVPGLEKLSGHVEIRWKFESEAEVMHLAQLKDLLDTRSTFCTLYVDYLPYARQDKSISNSSTFALNTFGRILNGMNFDRVFISDPHSGRALAVIANSRPTYPVERVEQLANSLAVDAICYPDSGAVRKYSPMIDFPYISGAKQRHQLTGAITEYSVSGSAPSVLIVDDICDGGGTFVLLAEKLKAQGTKNIYLFVSHGIFSKGLKPLFDAGISRVFTTEGEVTESKGLILTKEYE